MGWDTQSDNKDAKVQVSGSACKDGRERTDFLIIDKASGQHKHVSVGTGAKDGVVEHHGYQKPKNK